MGARPAHDKPLKVRRTAAKVNETHGLLFDHMKNPKMWSKLTNNNFTRRELISLFIRFKALCALSPTPYGIGTCTTLSALHAHDLTRRVRRLGHIQTWHTSSVCRRRLLYAARVCCGTQQLHAHHACAVTHCRVGACTRVFVVLLQLDKDNSGVISFNEYLQGVRVQLSSCLQLWSHHVLPHTLDVNTLIRCMFCDGDPAMICSSSYSKVRVSGDRTASL